jgi:hypothetical protein
MFRFSIASTASLATYCQHRATLVATVAVRLPIVSSPRATMWVPATG